MKITCKKRAIESRDQFLDDDQFGQLSWLKLTDEERGTEIFFRGRDKRETWYLVFDYMLDTTSP